MAQQKLYDQVKHLLGMDPGKYLRQLKAETGLSDEKLAHDLAKDCGLARISQPTAWKWRTSE